MTDELILLVAKAILARLNEQLADHYAATIILTRDEALLALGLFDGIVEEIGSHSGDPMTICPAIVPRQHQWHRFEVVI